MCRFAQWDAPCQTRRKASSTGASGEKVRAASSSIGVAIEPGLIEFTRMPSAAWSRASARVRLRIAPFGRRVRRDAPLARMSLHGRDIHNRAAAAFLHQRNAEASKQKDARDVHREASIPGLEVRFNRCPIRMYRGRIHEDIDAAG